MLDVVRKFGVEVIAETNVPRTRMCIRLSQWWNLMTLRQVRTGHYAEGLYAEWSYDSCGEVTVAKAKA